MSATSSDRRQQAWQRLRGQNGCLRGLRILESPVYARGQVTFGQFTVLTGLHGVGKSYLLSMLRSALPRWQVITNLPLENDGHQHQLRGEYQLAVAREGDVLDVPVRRPASWREREKSREAARPLTVTWVTPFGAMNELEFMSQDHDRLPEAAPLGRLNRRELEALRAITGHSYEWIEHGQIDTGREDFLHVRGVRGAKTVDLWSMSSAEFWVHYVLWHLKNSDENDVVLIDEPEAYLARPGHQAFIDEIARQTLASGCQTVVATQSEAMLQRVPPECLRLIVSGTDGAGAVEVNDLQTVSRVLGSHRCYPSTLVLVEDKLAAHVVRAIIQKHLPGRADEFDVIACAGKDEVLAARRIVGRSERFKVVAILDGDQREEPVSAVADPKGSDVLFLPGHGTPEQALLNQMDRDAASVGRSLGVAEAELRVALDAARFVDHQRIFDSIGRALGAVQADRVAGVAIDAWMVDEAVARQTSDLARQLSAPADIR